MNYGKQNGCFQSEEDPFSKGPLGISKTMHEVLKIVKISQSKPQNKITN